MKTSFKMVAMLLGIGVFPVCAQAQKKIVIEDEEPNSIMFVSRDKAGDEIIRIMNDRSQMRFHDPNAPRFLLTDQKGKFALGIGGYVRATGEYDFNGIVDDVDFYPALIGRPGKGNFAKNQFQMDITTSTLRTAKCLCTVPRFHNRIQLRFVYGPFGPASYYRLRRSERFSFLSYHATKLYVR